MRVLIVASRGLLALLAGSSLLYQATPAQLIPVGGFPVPKDDSYRMMLADRLFTHSAFRTHLPRFGKRAPHGGSAMLRQHARMNDRRRGGRLGSRKGR